jgi:exodeoxyribonuclease VII large subunit
VRLFPARVQGAGSVEDVSRGIQFFSQTGWAQITVIARGGGSLEDLWTFNEEAVARAIAASSVPVVSAIGHETDVTIADFVADLRAPTPSAAAEMIVCTRQELLDRIEGCRLHARRAIHYRLAVLARRLHEQAIDRAQGLLHRSLARRTQRVDDVTERLRNVIRRELAVRERRRRELESTLRYFDLRPRLRRDRERLNEASANIAVVMHRRMAQRRQRLELLIAKLTQLDPRLVLSRGYAIVLNDENRVVRSAADAPAGADVKVLLEKDALDARITGTHPEGSPDRT